jgi:hypothetical protein
MFKHAISTSLNPQKFLVRNTRGQLNVSVEELKNGSTSTTTEWNVAAADMATRRGG